MNGKILIRCPTMPILPTWKPWIRECQELFCPDNEITLDDGSRIPFVITFPRVLVRFQKIGHWLVDEVPAYGETRDGGQVRITMEKEHVERTSWWTMDAMPCAAQGTAEFAGRKWKIGPCTSPTGEETFFPKCTCTTTGLGLYRYLAEPIIAEGVLTSAD